MIGNIERILIFLNNKIVYELAEDEVTWKDEGKELESFMKNPRVARQMSFESFQSIDNDSNLIYMTEA